jgi:hypothetical protein
MFQAAYETWTKEEVGGTMAVAKIEKIERGVVKQRAEPNENGVYICHEFGKNTDPIKFSTLDEVADYLRSNPKAGVRMNPGWSKISRSVFIDGVPR